jgi:hypothetical protein
VSPDVAAIVAQVNEHAKSLVESLVAAIPKPKDGEPGKDGTSVDVEAVKADAAAQVKALLATFEQPRDGRDGPEGKPGRDAVAIQIHPAIDETRSYARGSYATHKGGIWRAASQTLGMEGWEPCVDGFAGISVRQIDDRTFELVAMKSSGAEDVQTFKSPSMIYRGVWRDMDYERGDVVTWGGSMWHCNEATASRPETVEGAKAWTLCAKRGDRGRDAPTK